MGTKRIKEELVSGKTKAFTIESYDPISSPDSTGATTYTLESHQPLKLTITTGWRVSQLAIDRDGFTRTAESTLSGNETLVTTCD